MKNRKKGTEAQGQEPTASGQASNWKSQTSNPGLSSVPPANPLPSALPLATLLCALIYGNPRGYQEVRPWVQEHPAHSLP